MILHDRTKAAQIFVLCRVHLRACFVHSLLSAAAIESLEQGNVSEMHTTSVRLRARTHTVLLYSI